MEIKSKYFLISQLLVVLMCVTTILIYHYLVINPQNTSFEEEKMRVIKVAEDNIFNSPKLSKFFASSTPTSFIEAAKKGKEGVVYIRSKAHDKAREAGHNSGSGVILSGDGYIITNFHVVGLSDEIEVVLADKRVFQSSVVGLDQNTDLALLKIEAEDLPFIIMGNSDSLQVGEWVMAVGNPFHLQSTVTAGIVSAKARNINLMESQGIESFIQTDAAVNPGSSGGALINTSGDLVGINTAIISEKGSFEGFSFAIPINVVKKVVADLKEFGIVQRGWLGVEIEEVDAKIADQLGMETISGVLVSSILKDGAAQKSGIIKNDVILEINAAQVQNTAEFMENIARYRPGTEISILVWRNGRKVNVKAILKNHLNSLDPVAVYRTGLFSELGIEVRNLDALEKSLFGKNGVLVVSVKRGSIVHYTKLEPGFIIQQMDGITIKDVTHLQELFQLKKGHQVLWEGIYKNYPGTYPYSFDFRM